MGFENLGEFIGEVGVGRCLEEVEGCGAGVEMLWNVHVEGDGLGFGPNEEDGGMDVGFVDVGARVCAELGEEVVAWVVVKGGDACLWVFLETWGSDDEIEILDVVGIIDPWSGKFEGETTDGIYVGTLKGKGNGGSWEVDEDAFEELMDGIVGKNEESGGWLVMKELPKVTEILLGAAWGKVVVGLVVEHGIGDFRLSGDALRTVVTIS